MKNAKIVDFKTVSDVKKYVCKLSGLTFAQMTKIGKASVDRWGNSTHDVFNNGSIRVSWSANKFGAMGVGLLVAFRDTKCRFVQINISDPTQKFNSLNP